MHRSDLQIHHEASPKLRCDLAVDLLHLPDGLRAEAPEGVGRNLLQTAVLLDVPEQKEHRYQQAGGPKMAVFHCLSSLSCVCVCV